MNDLQQTKKRIPWLALAGITAITLSTVFGLGGMSSQPPARQLGGSVNTQSVQPAAATVLSCPDYDTLYGANYNNLLDVSYSFLSQITTRLPGQNQSFLNFQYNAAANQAYSLYTSAMKANSCNPSIAAPTALSPASPPSSTIDPSTLDPSIPKACAYPLALQYVASYYQQYIQNMQNEQTNLTNFINKLQPPAGTLDQHVMSGAASVQTQFYGNVKNLTTTFSSDTSNIGC